MKSIYHTRLNKPEGSKLDQHDQVSKTRQSEKDSTDINKIMERFNRTGQLPAMQKLPPRFGDARSVDYATALNIVNEAREAFLQLPATTRKVFDNDPQMLEEFLSDPKNDKRAVELGLKEFKHPTSEQLLSEVVKNTKKEKETPVSK